MKRHLISDDTSQKDGTTVLSVLGNCPTLIDECRDTSDNDHRVLKKLKLQPETSTKIEDHDNKDKPKHCYLNLMSTAINLICDERRKIEERDNSSAQQQELPQEPKEAQASSSRSVTTAAISSLEAGSETARSRSSSLSSEISVYRSYEMELPDRPPAYNSTTGRLPSPPRLPTVSDLPQLPQIKTTLGRIGCQLNTRHYGEGLPLGQRGYERTNIDNKIQALGVKHLPNEIRIQAVKYH